MKTKDIRVHSHVDFDFDKNRKSHLFLLCQTLKIRIYRDKIQALEEVTHCNTRVAIHITWY
jgi:hypothetical protein